MAEVVHIAPDFSPAEQTRTVTAASRDPQLKAALGAAGYGLTQTLAAAPQLVARWEGAKTAAPYAWAVITAALDAARLGARAPLSADFLHEAAPGYCSSRQQAEAPGDWFEEALAYAAKSLFGARLRPCPGRKGHGPPDRLHPGGLPDPACRLASSQRDPARHHLGRRCRPCPRPG